MNRIVANAIAALDSKALNVADYVITWLPAPSKWAYQPNVSMFGPEKERRIKERKCFATKDEAIAYAKRQGKSFMISNTVNNAKVIIKDAGRGFVSGFEGDGFAFTTSESNAMRFDAPLSADIKKRMDAESIGPMGLQKVANAEETKVACNGIGDCFSDAEHDIEEVLNWLKKSQGEILKTLARALENVQYSVKYKWADDRDRAGKAKCEKSIKIAMANPTIATLTKAYEDCKAERIRADGESNGF